MERILDLKINHDLDKKTFVVFDLETTGFYFECFDEIMEIGAVKVSDALIKETFHNYILPRKKISQTVSEITGLTEEVILKNNPTSLKKSLTNFREFIGDSILVCHNAKFDIPFTNYYLNFFGLPLLTNYVCTERSFRAIKKPFFVKGDGRMKTNLQEMCNFFEVKNNQAHNGLEDALATAKCFIEMLNQGLCISYNEISLKDAYVTFKKRVFNSSPFKTVMLSLTTIESVTLSHQYVKDRIKENVMDDFNNQVLFEDIMKKYSLKLGEVKSLFIEWVTPINKDYYPQILNGDKRLIHNILELLANNHWDIDETYEMFKGLCPYSMDKFKFIIVKKLYSNISKFKYTINDFAVYFKDYQNLEEVANKAQVPIESIFDFLVEWLKNNEEYIVLWIKIIGKWINIHKEYWDYWQIKFEPFVLTHIEYERMVNYEKKDKIKYQIWYDNLSEYNKIRIKNTQELMNLKIIEY